MTITYQEWRSQRNPHPGIATFLPGLALRLGLMGMTFWMFANSLVVMSATQATIAPYYRPFLPVAEAIILDPVVNSTFREGSNLCLSGGVGVIGGRYLAFLTVVKWARNREDGVG